METVLLIGLGLMVLLGIAVTAMNAADRNKMSALLEDQPAPQRPEPSAGRELLNQEEEAARKRWDVAHEKSDAIHKEVKSLLDDCENGRITDSDLEKLIEPILRRQEAAQAELGQAHAEYMAAVEANTAAIHAGTVALEERTAEYTANGALPSDSQSAFVATMKHLASDGSAGIAVDRVNRKVALLTPYGKNIVGYDQLLSSEICVDSETVVQTNRGSLIGGALVGGLVSGGVGAIVMALGAKKKHIDNIRSVELKVLTVGTYSHAHTVSFYKKGQFGSPQGAIDEATSWHDLIAVAIKETELANRAAQSVEPSRAQGSLSDELTKLAQLKQQGLLTEEEFAKAKAALI